MPYTITTHTTDGLTHSRTCDTLDQLDEFVGRIQYRDNSQLLTVADSPLTLTYAGNVKHVTVDGLTQADIAAHAQAKAEKQQAEFHRLVAEKTAAGSFYPPQGVIGGGQLAANCVADSALARVAR